MLTQHPSFKPASLAFLMAVLALLLSHILPFSALADTSGASGHDLSPFIMARVYLAWWSLDATGYHPAIYMRLENVSGKDLSGQMIRFQGRFMDLRTGIPTVARTEIRQDFESHQQIYLLLRGPLAFELSKDVSDWPPIECKVMCRVGTVGDEGTQSLLVTRLEPVTMSDQDAFDKINKMPGFRCPPRIVLAATHGPNWQTRSMKPLLATCGVLKVKPKAKGREVAGSRLMSYVSGHALPGLADDFYRFEQCFGLPSATDTSEPGWSWACYKHSNPSLELFVGSKGLTGKADLLVAQFPQSEVKNESEILTVCRAFTGRYKNPKWAPLSRSVRYLASGRVQSASAKAPGLEFMYLAPPDAGQLKDTVVVILCRLPGGVESNLGTHAKRVQMISQLSPYFADN